MGMVSAGHVANAVANHKKNPRPNIVPMAHVAAENPNQYNVNLPGMSEAITQPLYDIQAWGASGVGVSTYTFFTTPQGQSSKTLEDTNMTLAGTIPEPQSFRIEEITIEWYPGTATTALPVVYGAGAASGEVNDMFTVFRKGFLQLNIGSKNYLQLAPLSKMPAKSFFSARGAASDSTTAGATQQWRMQVPFIQGPCFRIRPFLLPAMQNFSMTLNFPTAITLPSGDTGARIGITMWGTLYRAVQ